MQFVHLNNIGGTTTTSGNGGGSGSITITGNTGSSDYEHPTGWLWGNKYTGKEVLDGDITSKGTITGVTIKGDKGDFGEVDADHIIVDDYVTADEINADTGNFEDVNVTDTLSVDTALIDNATIKDLFVSGSAHFVELIIDKINSTEGSLILSPAHAEISRVEREGNIIKCYFLSTDGDKTITNDFEVDDLVICESFNVSEGYNEDISNKFIWKRVLEVGTTEGDSDDDPEHWFSVYATDYLEEYSMYEYMSYNNNSEFEAQDVVCVLGNATKENRQKAILLSCTNPNLVEIGHVESRTFTEYHTYNNPYLTTVESYETETDDTGTYVSESANTTHTYNYTYITSETDSEGKTHRYYDWESGGVLSYGQYKSLYFCTYSADNDTGKITKSSDIFDINTGKLLNGVSVIFSIRKFNPHYGGKHKYEINRILKLGCYEMYVNYSCDEFHFWFTKVTANDDGTYTRYYSKSSGAYTLSKDARDIHIGFISSPYTYNGTTIYREYITFNGKKYIFGGLSSNTYSSDDASWVTKLYNYNVDNKERGTDSEDVSSFYNYLVRLYIPTSVDTYSFTDDTDANRILVGNGAVDLYGYYAEKNGDVIYNDTPSLTIGDNIITNGTFDDSLTGWETNMSIAPSLSNHDFINDDENALFYYPRFAEKYGVSGIGDTYLKQDVALEKGYYNLSFDYIGDIVSESTPASFNVDVYYGNDKIYELPITIDVNVAHKAKFVIHVGENPKSALKKDIPTDYPSYLNTYGNPLPTALELNSGKGQHVKNYICVTSAGTITISINSGDNGDKIKWLGIDNIYLSKTDTSGNLFTQYNHHSKKNYTNIINNPIGAPAIITFDNINEFSLADKHISVFSPTYNLISASSVSGLDSAIGASSTISSLADQIALKVNQTDYDTLSGRVTANESSITLLSDQIALKVSQSDFDALGNRVTTNESNITQNANSINLRVDSIENKIYNENLFPVDGWITGDVYDTTIDNQVSITMTDDYGYTGGIWIYSPIIYLEAGDYVLSSYNAQHNQFIYAIPYDSTESTTGGAQQSPVSSSATSITTDLYKGIYRTYDRFTISKNGCYRFEIMCGDGSDDDEGNPVYKPIYRPKLEKGTTPTAYTKQTVSNSSIKILKDEISSTVSQTEFDALGNRVTANESSITQNADQIALKVSQTEFDTLTGRVTTAESTIEQQATKIDAMVTKDNLETVGIHLDGDDSTIKLVGNKTFITNTSGETTFSIDANGNLVASGDATFTGKINATGGTFKSNTTSGLPSLNIDTDSKSIDFSGKDRLMNGAVDTSIACSDIPYFNVEVNEGDTYSDGSSVYYSKLTMQRNDYQVATGNKVSYTLTCEPKGGLTINWTALDGVSHSLEFGASGILFDINTLPTSGDYCVAGQVYRNGNTLCIKT